MIASYLILIINEFYPELKMSEVQFLSIKILLLQIYNFISNILGGFFVILNTIITDFQMFIFISNVREKLWIIPNSIILQ